MHRVVGAEVQGVQHRAQHATIVVAIGGAHGLLDLAFKLEAHGLELSDQFLQGLLADHWIDHVLDHPVRLVHRGLGQFEQQLGLSPDLLERGELPLVDPLFGSASQIVDELEQEVDQRIGELLASTPAEHGHHAVTDRRRVAAQLPDRFGGATPAELVEEPGGDIDEQAVIQADGVNALQPGYAGEQIVKARLARIGLEVGK